MLVPAAKDLKLSIRAEPKLLPVATSFVESAAKSFGLGSKEALSLALSTEEIFMHLCRVRPGAPLAASASDGGFCAAVEFKFDGTAFDMRDFNITAKAEADASEESIAHTGLILAARSVDSFSLSIMEGGGVKLRLVKEKAYPASVAESFERVEAKSWSVKRASPEELHLLCRMLPSFVPSEQVPGFLKCPGKATDMYMTGKLFALLAKAPDRALCGGVLWRGLSPVAIECFGPYPFISGDRGGLAKVLLDSFISDICKGDTLIVIDRHIDEAFATGFFEPLGGAGERAFFRQLDEDSGSTLWTSKSIDSYVRGECGRLFLPRNFVAWDDSLAPDAHVHSVMFTALDHARRRAAMRPVRHGFDLGANIAGHLKSLRAEGFSEILFELDLGIPWHCPFAEAAAEAGFAPSLLLPSAGDGDILEMRSKG